MAIPTFGGRWNTGVTVTGTGATAVTNNAAILDSGHVIFLTVLQDGTAANTTISGVHANVSDLAGTASAMTAFPGNPYTVGNPAAGKLLIWVARVTTFTASATTIVSVTSSGGDDLYLQGFNFSENVNTGSNFSDVIENGSAGTVNSAAVTSATVNDVDVTTLGPDRVAINVIGVNDDNALAAFTGMTGGTWVEIPEYLDSTGTDGCVGGDRADMTSAGTIGGGSQTMAASDGVGVVGFAVIGTTVTSTLVLSQGFTDFNDPGVY